MIESHPIKRFEGPIKTDTVNRWNFIKCQTRWFFPLDLELDGLKMCTLKVLNLLVLLPGI